MPRPPRLLLSQSFYHIMTRGNNKNIVFHDDEDYQYYIKLIFRYKKDHPFDLYHYILMPTHIHQLVKVNKTSDFSVYMKKINLAYFHHYRQKYGWVGHFWQDRFKSQPVGNDVYFIQCGKYIELNPVRKNLVENPGDYPFSSHNHYAKGAFNPLITDDFFYKDLGKNKNDRMKEYQNLVIDDIVLENYKKIIWGSSIKRYNESKKIHNYYS